MNGYLSIVMIDSRIRGLYSNIEFIPWVQKIAEIVILANQELNLYPLSIID